MEKQQATNVFLGLFVPKEKQPNIWDLTTDFYLHNKEADGRDIDRRRYFQNLVDLNCTQIVKNSNRTAYLCILVWILMFTNIFRALD